MFLDGRFIDTKTFKNLVINGDFVIAQRGTTFTDVTNGDYMLDRWQFSNASNTVHCQASREFDQNYGYYLHLEVTQEDTSPSARMGIHQWTEWDNYYYGKTITMSGWVRTNITDIEVTPIVKTSAGKAVVDSIPLSLPADTWTFINVTYTVPTSFTDTPIGFTFWRLNTPETLLGKYIDIAMCQAEICSRATPFEKVPYDVQLYRAKRYFERIRVTGWRVASSSDQVAQVYYDVEKRVFPGVLLYAPSNNAIDTADLYYYDGTALQSTQIPVEIRNVRKTSVSVVNFNYDPPVNDNVRFIVDVWVDAEIY